MRGNVEVEEGRALPNGLLDGKGGPDTALDELGKWGAVRGGNEPRHDLAVERHVGPEPPASVTAGVESWTSAIPETMGGPAATGGRVLGVASPIGGPSPLPISGFAGVGVPPIRTRKLWRRLSEPSEGAVFSDSALALRPRAWMLATSRLTAPRLTSATASTSPVKGLGMGHLLVQGLRG